MSGLDLTLKLRRTGDGAVLAFDVNRAAHNELWQYVNEVGAKTNDFFRLQLGRPFRPRSTGRRSQESRFRGHCEDLAEQVIDPNTGERLYTPGEVADAMKRMAVEEGYPTHLGLDGVETPNSTADLSMEQEAILLRIQQRYADVHGFWLTEYDDTVTPPIPYRSVGGRSRKEMEKYWEEAGR